MALVEKSVLIERTPAQMFALVDRIEDYPQFLPWCGGTDLHERTPTRTAATVHINYHGLKSHFSTETAPSPTWTAIGASRRWARPPAR